MGVIVPNEYTQYVMEHGCFEGLTADETEPGYVELWPLDAIHGNNRDIEIEKYAAGFVAFAGNGGGEVLAFDATGAVFMLPLIGMAPDCAKRIAEDFRSLTQRFVR
ncbi:hypothetical protein GM658_06125 [Pseudoduganella eburnea]|uniref:Knr4/Smi1-like domain-containing protein n=1 Tax=Massilia eburnea TaxID=1776165 RepID=A0A6L6QDA7_9BURK|nr:SMI1/KNR4 family protein [Massilia eburnea]MTW10175.1 hypothetical protein [Massilia eburnea]